MCARLGTPKSGPQITSRSGGEAPRKMSSHLLLIVFPTAWLLMASYSEHESLALSLILLEHCVLAVCLALDFLFCSLTKIKKIRHYLDIAI